MKLRYVVCEWEVRCIWTLHVAEKWFITVHWYAMPACLSIILMVALQAHACDAAGIECSIERACNDCRWHTNCPVMTVMYWSSVCPRAAPYLRHLSSLTCCIDCDLPRCYCYLFRFSLETVLIAASELVLAAFFKIFSVTNSDLAHCTWQMPHWMLAAHY